MPVHKRIGATGPTAGLRRAHVEDAAGAAELLAILGYRAPLAQIEERIARRTKSPDADGRGTGVLSNPIQNTQILDVEQSTIAFGWSLWVVCMEVGSASMKRKNAQQGATCMDR
jgi:hypothetical protein